MSEFNLKNDIIFTAFFARKGNEEFLIDFFTKYIKNRNKENKNKRRSKFRKVISWRKRRKARYTSRIKRRNNSKYRNANEKSA